MAVYGTKSTNNLLTCHPVLQVVMREVVKHFDNSIIYGARTAEEQFELFKQGRIQNPTTGEWEITGHWVTKCDGYQKKSDHQVKSDGFSWAVDAVPYPIDWPDVNRMRYFAGYVVGTARQLYDAGRIGMLVGSGIDWDKDTEVKDQRFEDLPHLFVYEP